MPLSKSNWRTQIKNLVQRFDHFYFYSADPGASAAIRPLYEEANNQSKALDWYVEGWATHAYLPNSVYISNKGGFLNPSIDTGNAAILMGQQVNHRRAYENLKHFKEVGLSTIFISDHWKGIAEHFKPDVVSDIILPDKIYVPDQVAYDVQKGAFANAGIPDEQVNKVLEVFVHPGLEQSLEKIKAYSESELSSLRQKYNISENAIVMMLDCIQDHEIQYFGFNWKTALESAYQYFEQHYSNTTLLIKPHPRQDIKEVKAYLQDNIQNENVKLVDEAEGEVFAALADEVWGITTILLVVALKAGKTIKSFMPNRLETGKKESNKHIEPFVIE